MESDNSSNTRIEYGKIAGIKPACCDVIYVIELNSGEIVEYKTEKEWQFLKGMKVEVWIEEVCLEVPGCGPHKGPIVLKLKKSGLISWMRNLELISIKNENFMIMIALFSFLLFLILLSVIKVQLGNLDFDFFIFYFFLAPILWVSLLIKTGVRHSLYIFIANIFASLFLFFSLEINVNLKGENIYFLTKEDKLLKSYKTTSYEFYFDAKHKQFKKVDLSSSVQTRLLSNGYLFNLDFSFVFKKEKAEKLKSILLNRLAHEHEIALELHGYTNSFVKKEQKDQKNPEFLKHLLEGEIQKLSKKKGGDVNSLYKDLEVEISYEKLNPYL
jgi:hypothetical protein